MKISFLSVNASSDGSFPQLLKSIMVSQSQDSVGWEGSGSPSRTGSLLSLDGRQRPAPAKTPPSYYDAVRSRHSLSQPRPSDGSKQEKGHPGQQVKYNSLPR